MPAIRVISRVRARFLLSVLIACTVTAARAQTNAAPPNVGVSPASAGAVPASDGVIALDKIIVKGEAMRGTNAPFSVDAFTASNLRDLYATHPQDLFEQVAGMNVRFYGLSGVANVFVMRGFGGGGHGGDVGFVLDGIPLNEAMSHDDGYFDLNIIVPLEIGATTIYKGPVSALYGNFNRAGLIAIETRKGGSYGNVDSSAGSDKTFDTQFAFGRPVGEHQQLNFAGQVYHTDGFRPQSQFDRGTLSGRWSVELTPTVQLALSGRVYRGYGDSAAYITRPQYDVDPYGIDPRVQNDGSTKNFATLRGDFNLKLNPELKLLAFAYGTQQDFTRWYSRPISTSAWAQREETYHRDVTGAGTNLNGQKRVGAGLLNWVGGVETFRESTYYGYYDGENHRQRVNPAIDDRTTDLNSGSAFGELEAPLHPLFKPWIGARYDRFTGATVRNGPETGNDPDGGMPSKDHNSPKIGVRSEVLPGVQLRANWAEGFALAPTFAKYSLGSANLAPNIFRQSELGGAFQLGKALSFDLAGYQIKSSQEIRTVSVGVYENFGATERTGVEGKLTWKPLTELAFSFVYSNADSEVKQNANAALLGKKVAGVSDKLVTVNAAWSPVRGWGGSATLRYVGPYAVDAANTLFSDSSTTLDLALNYSGTFSSDKHRYRAYASIENVFDRKYTTSVTLSNKFQLIEPGAPLSFRVGVQFDF